MKVFFLSLLVSISTSFVQAQSNDLICETLNDYAQEDCEIALCEEVEAEGNECFKDGDFYVEVSECVYETFADLVNEHNTNNPDNTVRCED